MTDWSRGWAREASDRAVGDAIIELLAPVMVHLVDRGLALNTSRRHRDNLRMLGQKVLDKMTQFPECAPGSVGEALDDLLDGCSIGEGGPELRPVYGDGDPELEAILDVEQHQFDTTCRLVYKFRSTHVRPRPAGEPKVTADLD